jgi:predicted metal-dependent HD superfamily phosphohydrolase
MRWFDIFKTCGAVGNPQMTFRELVLRYSETHRHYHTLSHIEHCIRNMPRDCRNPDALEMAIWYHDAEYTLVAKDNETQSARIAAIDLHGASFEFVQEVEDLIQVTDHKTSPKTYDQQLIVDIDLAIFSEDDRTFDDYEEGIWKEYGQVVCREVFCQKRIEVLERFLKHPEIYLTPPFRSRNDAARRNLMRSIDLLKKS